jgi:RimJ/RimL family protein N-acetyltransferase
MPIFEGRLIRLRAVEPSDWETHYAWDLDEETGRMTDHVWFPGSREAVREWALAESRKRATGDDFRFQIERLDGVLVGTINTHHCDPRIGTFQYGLGILPPYRRNGYASEAIALTLRYYFHERRYQKVNASVYSFNEPSIRLHERLGFALEGRLRRNVYTLGQYFDLLLYGLTREEFEASDWMPGS